MLQEVKAVKHHKKKMLKLIISYVTAHITLHCISNYVNMLLNGETLVHT